MKLTPAYIAAQVATCEFDYKGTTTICTLTLHNGYKLFGESACIDPSNYDREKGEQAAHDSALEKLWDREAYVLYKLGLRNVPGDLLQLYPADQHISPKGSMRVCSVAVKFDTVVRKAKEPEPQVNVTNHANLHLDPESIKKHLSDSPTFGRTVIDIIMKNKGKLGFADGGYVGGKKDGAE